MSEQTAETEAPQEGGEATEPKTFDADYVSKLRSEAAKYRSEAKANAEAAKRLADLENAQKSEAEKAADRVRALEEEAASARREALRFKVAAKFGIDGERAELLLTGADEATMTKQAEALTAAADERKKQGNRVPREGATPDASPNGNAAFARNLFGGAD